MSEIYCKGPSFKPGGDDNKFVFVFERPGRVEVEFSAPASGTTGVNLRRLLRFLSLYESLGNLTYERSMVVNTYCIPKYQGSTEDLKDDQEAKMRRNPVEKKRIEAFKALCNNPKLQCFCSFGAVANSFLSKVFDDSDFAKKKILLQFGHIGRRGLNWVSLKEESMGWPSNFSTHNTDACKLCAVAFCIKFCMENDMSCIKKKTCNILSISPKGCKWISSDKR